MISNRIDLHRIALTGILLSLLTGFAHADLAFIQYFDSATDPQFGGPLWTGTVDTVTDKLRIETWVEKPRHSDDFWVPASLHSNPKVPLIWDAVDSTGARFNVPKNFGIGGVTFGVDIPDGLPPSADDFAFVSPVSLQDMDWHTDTTDDGSPDTSPVVQFTGSTVFYPGWGGFAFDSPINGHTVRTKQTVAGGDPFDYLMIPTLPTSSTVAKASTLATITVTGRIVTDDAIITAVPEASSFLGVALIGAVCAVGSWMRKKRLAKLPSPQH